MIFKHVEISCQSTTKDHLGFSKPSSTPSATDLTALEISCLDVYARHTFRIALREIKRKFSISVAANPEDKINV